MRVRVRLLLLWRHLMSSRRLSSKRRCCTVRTVLPSWRLLCDSAPETASSSLVLSEMVVMCWPRLEGMTKQYPPHLRLHRRGRWRPRRRRCFAHPPTQPLFPTMARQSRSKQPSGALPPLLRMVVGRIVEVLPLPIHRTLQSSCRRFIRFMIYTTLY